MKDGGNNGKGNKGVDPASFGGCIRYTISGLLRLRKARALLSALNSSAAFPTLLYKEGFWP